MSAVDWAADPTDLMYVAAYLAQIGLDARALKIFEQVSQACPDRPEPYINGLRIAQKLDDLEGIQWATVGILGRAWPKDQAEVWIKGMRVARATLEKLKEDKRAKEAQEYEAMLNQALVRDVVARVSWTGNADVDLMVEEPSGTICSHRNPRTTGGGIMMGDKFSSAEKDNPEGFSEVYVCPRGFSGDYKLAVRRVWGEVTAGKVTVDVYINWNTKEAKHISKRISLGDKGAMVAFDLDAGRRKESVKEQQVANAAVGQLAVRQQVLAQQLAAATDPNSMMNLARSRQGSAGGANRERLLPDAPGSGGLPARCRPLARRGQSGGHGRDLGRPALRSHQSQPHVHRKSAKCTRSTGSPASSGTSSGGTGGSGFGGGMAAAWAAAWVAALGGGMGMM